MSCNFSLKVRRLYAIKIGNIGYNPDTNIVTVDGDWTVLHISSKDLHKAEKYLLTNFANTLQKKDLVLDIVSVKELDSVGGYFLSHFIKTLKTAAR
jgi:hypothetical protein